MFGSANFDNRSLELNDELNVAVISRDLAARLAADFEKDLRVVAAARARRRGASARCCRRRASSSGAPSGRYSRQLPDSADCSALNSQTATSRHGTNWEPGSCGS